MTQYVVTGIGKLLKLNAVSAEEKTKLDAILQKAIPYLDSKTVADYKQLVKNKVDLKKLSPSYITIQYLYMRSFFTAEKMNAETKKIHDYYLTRLAATWLSNSKYMQAMSALALHRNGNNKTAKSILQSLTETSIVNEELGRYWKNLRNGWYWYEADISRQATIIEAFHEVNKDVKTVDELKTWLLKNKQTNRWESSVATADAVYAILLRGSNWVDTETEVQIQMGSLSILGENEKQEAGTGYFKTSIAADKVKPNMGTIQVITKTNNTSDSTSSWGAVYWQYFEDLDKITYAETPLSIQKKLFVETNTDRGPVLTPIESNKPLKVGDKVKVRVELRVDRDMEYVHMKDMRAAASEPVNVISSYKWQGGLGYYESTKDASTNFFFNTLRKGTYVFEYPLFITHSGTFSNGITTIQCLYAPEFTSHSEGIRIIVE